MPAKRNLKIKPSALDDLYKALWLRKHYGVMAHIAKQVGVTPQMVRSVFWGRARSLRVEKAFSEHGFTIVGPPVRRRNVQRP